MTAEKPSLFLIDGYALLYRVYFAFLRNPLTTPEGENVSAVYGFLNSLLKIIREHEPGYLGLVFDTKEPTFRHEIYPEYKATREKMPEDLVDQIPYVRDIAEAMRIPVLEYPGYEADDVIGTLAVKAVGEGLEVVIVSGDKDFYQLVREGLVLFDPRKTGKEDEWVSTENVDRKFDVPAGGVRDLLALMGDSSDNIPGIKGIGQKTAAKIIGEFGSLDALYENLDRVGSESLRSKLEQGRENALFSRELVTIRVDLPIELDLSALERGEPDRDRLGKLLDELRFDTLKTRILGDEEGEKSHSREADYRIVEGPGGLEELLRRIGEEDFVSIDLETTDLDPHRAEIVGIALCVEEGEAFYLPIMHDDAKNLDRAETLSALAPLLASDQLKKVGQNIKYDATVLAQKGITLAGIHFDTMIAAYLLDPERRSYGLDSLARSFLGHTMISYDDVTGKGKNRIPFEKVPVETAKRYSCEDADYTLRLYRLLEPELEDRKQLDLFRDVEIPLIGVLVDMERAGVSIDVSFLKELSDSMGSTIGGLEREIIDLAGEEFNINSTRQLSHVLFEKLHLPVVKKTRTGYSTDIEVLESLAQDHEIARKLIEYRELVKLKSTYVDALPKQINPGTGRVHTSFNQVVTATGRLSSSDPNLQNIPVRTELGREIRRGFVPSAPGRKLLTADYSQIELRIVAHLSRDENMINAFNFGADIHRQTAALVFGLDPQDVTPGIRSRAKEINFGVIYGMGPYGLSRRLGIPIEEARSFIDSYFERYRGVREFTERTVAEVKEKGYVTTLLGRRRYLPNIASRNRNVREFAVRTAINSPVQGTAADLIKVAMIDIHRELETSGVDARMIIQVHDELVFDVAGSDVDALSRIVRDRMENAIELVVPVTVDIGTGQNWYLCKS